MPPTNYQHTVGYIQGRYDLRGRLSVRFLFHLDDGSCAAFRGPRGQWLWTKTKGRSPQEIQARLELFMRKALKRLFGLSDVSLHFHLPAGGPN